MTQTNVKLKRIADAVELEVPDRVPIFLQPNYLPAKIAGLTYRDLYYNQDEYLDALRRLLIDLDPDLFLPGDTPVVAPGPINDLWGTVQIKWPGHGIGVNVSHQFVESEYMKQEEYDHFLDDPTDFLIRVYTPRIFKKMAGLSMLPPLINLSLGCYFGAAMANFFSTPPIAAALEAMQASAKTGAEWTMKFSRFHQEMAELGIYASHAATAMVPFDIISDMLRGMKGSMMDMFQVPEKLLAAQEKLYPSVLEGAVQVAKVTGNPRVFIPLHRGADGFMSPKQFELFYWPMLKKLILDLIDEELTPLPFFEGVYEQRLQYLAELPKGKVIGWFDRSDLSQVKAALKDTMCIAAGMPVSLLQTGTPETVKEYTRKIIDTAGGDGGLIMATNTVLDEANPELIKVWVDYTKEYGRYV